MRRIWSTLSICAIVIIGLIWAVFRTVLPRDSVSVPRQPSAERSLFIARLHLRHGGFLVAHTARDIDANGSTIVGNSDYLPPGVYANFHIEFFDSYGKPWPHAGELLFLTIYRDNGDTFFDATLDVPVGNRYGKPITQKVQYY